MLVAMRIRIAQGRAAAIRIATGGGWGTGDASGLHARMPD